MTTTELKKDEVKALNKMRVNLDQTHSLVSIISVTLATNAHCKKAKIAYDVKEIVTLIRKNRETSTTVLHAEQVAFNPTLTVYGTNCRLFPLYYVAFNNRKDGEIFVNPEKAETVEAPETVAA